MKNYILDSNVLINNFNAIENLLDDGKNKVSIPINVILELDNLKNDKKIGFIVRKAINEIEKHFNEDTIRILDDKGNSLKEFYNTPDGKILNDIINNDLSVEDDNIFLTNDKIFSILSKHTINKKHIYVDEYKTKNNYVSDAKKFTGLLDSPEDNIIGAANFFCFDKSNGTLNFHNRDGLIRDTQIKNPLSLWKFQTKHYSQHMFYDLVLNPDIDIISISGQAGFGKSFLALSAALHLIGQKKQYKTLTVIKSLEEAGKNFGFLPGDVHEKLSPFFHPIIELLYKLHTIRPCNYIWEGDPYHKKINSKIVNLMPINFARGCNLDGVILVDEAQNFSQEELRTILTRVCDDSLVILTGDPSQIDNPSLNEYNNGLSVIVRYLIKEPNYAHIVMTGKHSRGVITDTILKVGL